MGASSIKEEARRLIDKLPEESTWDDLMHEIYVRQVVEAGLEDSKAGRTTDVEQVREKFGLSQELSNNNLYNFTSDHHYFSVSIFEIV